MAATGCGPAGLNHGKLGSLLDVGGTLYAVVNTQSRPWPYPDFQVWRSDDHGATWLKPTWSFRGTAQTIVSVRPGFQLALFASVIGRQTAGRVMPAR